MSDPVFGLPPDLVRGPEYDALPLAGEVNWGMDVFRVDDLRALTASAPPIKVGVVDTGVDPGHPLLANLKGSRDFTGSRHGPRDVHGHGTHVTGTVAAVDPRIGVADNYPVYHGKGLGDSGQGGNSLMNAIEWCLSEGCRVVSNSWGGGGPNPDWDRRFREWAERGVWLIFAGGNSGPNTRDADYPGVSEHLLNVAALDSQLRPAGFSSAGDKLDTSGPGVDIVSARPGGGFATMSGTSMACPFVAGTLTRYMAGLLAAGLPVPTVYQLRQTVFARSTDTHTPGDDRRTGPGWLTPLLLGLTLTPDPRPVA